MLHIFLTYPHHCTFSMYALDLDRHGRTRACFIFLFFHFKLERSYIFFGQKYKIKKINGNFRYLKKRILKMLHSVSLSVFLFFFPSKGLQICLFIRMFLLVFVLLYVQCVYILSDILQSTYIPIVLPFSCNNNISFVWSAVLQNL